MQVRAEKVARITEDSGTPGAEESVPTRPFLCALLVWAGHGCQLHGGALRVLYECHLLVCLSIAVPLSPLLL